MADNRTALTAGERVKAVFLRLGATPVGVREVMDGARGLERSTVSKMCLFMARLGWVDAKMVSAWHHGRRYQFTATPALLRQKPALRDACDLVLWVMRIASGGLTNTDMRYSISGLFGIRKTKREIQVAIEVLVETHKMMRAEGDTQKLPRYVLGRASALPWAVLEGALRRISPQSSE